MWMLQWFFVITHAKLRWGANVATMALAACLAGCKADERSAAQRSIESGEAQRALQAMLDRSPQCAMLLHGQSPLSVATSEERLPGVRALVAADLIARGRPETSGMVDYQITAAGRPFIRLRPGDSATTELCYAHRKIVTVWLKPLEGKTDPLTRLGYAYVLTDAPAWTRRTDMMTAFPCLVEAFRVTHTPQDLILFERGHWKASFIVPVLSDTHAREAFWARSV